MRRIKTVFRDKNKARVTPVPTEGQLGREAAIDPPASSPQEDQPSSSSGQSGNVSAFPDGVKVWHECPDALVDICFVHGLTGNRDTTWTAHGQPIPWPKALLPSQLPRSRLLTYGYDAYVVRASVASTNRLLDHATNLLVDLTNNRENDGASTRPLIFVAHSLGGLVCKEAILLSRTHHDTHLRTIFDNVIGILFMSTPHKGSWMADWAHLPASALGLVKSTNKKLLAILETDNQLLDSIQVSFLSLLRDVRERGRRLDVTCFFEELPLTGAGRVVSKESATLGGYTAISIHSNHRDMARFVSERDTGFQRLLGELRRWTDSRVPGADCQLDTVVVPPTAVITEKDCEPVHEACYYIPFPKNKKFVGRQQTLERLQDMFFAQDCQKAAIVGLGGIGKTQVALQLAYWVKENRPGYSIFWIPALSTATFQEAFDEIARQLGIQKRSNIDDPKDLVRRYLSADAAGPWLLIVDNADDGDVVFAPGGLTKYLPESERGITLFTTRSRDVAVETGGADVVELGNMDQTEAKIFLERSLIRKGLVDNIAAEELLEEMTYLPLAITQAAAYLNKNQVSIAEYLKLLHSAEENMVSLLSREFRDNTRYTDSKNSLAATWLVSFEQILKMDALAAKLLSFISCIEPKAIPLSILPKPQVVEHMTRAIGLLCGYAFLNRRGDTDVFDMHSLVHVAIGIWLETNQRAQAALTHSIEHLGAIFPTNARYSHQLCRSLLPHALHILGRSQESEAVDKCVLSFRVGYYLYLERRSEDAILFLREACRWTQEHLTEYDTNRLTAETHLAWAYNQDYQSKEAIKIPKHVMAIQEQTLPEGAPARLMTERELASAYINDRQPGKAITMLEHVVAMTRMTVAKDDSLLASEYELARAYLSNNQAKNTIKILARFAELSTLSSAFDEANQASSEGVLAAAYHKNGQANNAVPLLEHVVKIREKMYPEDHLDLLSSQHNLACTYADVGRLGEAKHLMENVVAVRARKMPNSDPHSLISRKALARILQMTDHSALVADAVTENLYVIELLEEL